MALPPRDDSRRDHPRHGFHRGSDPWPAGVLVLQRTLRLIHVSPAADLRGQQRRAAGLATAAGQCDGKPSGDCASATAGTPAAIALLQASDCSESHTAFSSPEVLDYAEYAGLHYAIGFARNDRLLDRVVGLCEKADRLWESNRTARGYACTRASCIGRGAGPEHSRGSEDRTHSAGNEPALSGHQRRGRAEEVFTWYEQRGQAENFIKELKNDLEADRLSCMEYRANAFRLQLHVLAYNLFVLFRRHVLRGTELARAAVGTIRLRLLKIGARVKLSARRLWFHLASGWPGRLLLLNVLDRLAALGPPS